MDEDIELAGVVTKIDFVNPHSWVHFEVTGADGSKSAHRCELRSATTLRRSGWTPEMFAAGTRMTIQGSPDRAEKNACYVSTITFGDGTVLDRYGQRIPAKAAVERVTRLPSGEPNLSGDWAAEQLVMTDPAGRDGTLGAAEPRRNVRARWRAGRSAGDSRRARHAGGTDTAHQRTGRRRPRARTRPSH